LTAVAGTRSEQLLQYLDQYVRILLLFKAWLVVLMRTWRGSYVLMRSWLAVALLLWLGTAAAGAAAPRVGPRAAARSQLERDNPEVSAGTIVPTVADVITEKECPGIQANGTSCGKVRGGLACNCIHSALAVGYLRS
jgi:hypothetical protein